LSSEKEWLLPCECSVNVLAADIQAIQLQDVDPWKFFIVTGLQPNTDRAKGANDLEELADLLKIAAREV
jgi:hypothetical protein